jgi:hypothetical protein
MTDGVMICKTAWCFTCGAGDCQHIRNINQELINAMQDGEVFGRSGQIISVDDVYLSKPDPVAGWLEEVFSVSAVSERINAALEARGRKAKEKPNADPEV